MVGVCLCCLRLECEVDYLRQSVARRRVWDFRVKGIEVIGLEAGYAGER